MPVLQVSSVAQINRPAEAGVVVPVVMRKTKHLHQAYFRAAVEVKRPAADALPSGLRRSLAPQAIPAASIRIEFASPCPPPALTVWPIARSFWSSSPSAPLRSIVTVSGIH